MAFMLSTLFVIASVAFIGGVIVITLFAIKRKSVEAGLQELQNPPALHSSQSVPETLRLVRGVLKNQDFQGKRWTIKEDNPNGMMIATMSFDENLTAGDGLAKRQLILTVSSAAENELTKVTLLYNIYSTFGMKTAEAILRQTTAAICKEILAG